MLLFKKPVFLKKAREKCTKESNKEVDNNNTKCQFHGERGPAKQPMDPQGCAHGAPSPASAPIMLFLDLAARVFGQVQ